MFRLHLLEITWQTRCHMFTVTHRHDFVSQKVCDSRCLVWTRAWTRLVVDILRKNMSVEHKHRKLCDKLYTDTSSYEKNCMRTRPCKSKCCVEKRFFTVNTHHSPSRRSNQCSQTWFHMCKVAYWQGFVSYVMWLYIVSTMTMGNLMTNMVSYVKVTHRHVFVRQKMCRHPSFSVWRRAWTRLVVDTLRGYMSVEHKNRKLCDKLYTNTSSYERICMRTHPCKSKCCVEGRLFTVNTHHSPSHRSNQCSQTWFHMWKVAYWEGS